MKFAKKYKLVSTMGQRATPPVLLPPREAGLQSYERAASAMTENITDRSLPPDVALENHAFLRENYMEALNRIMRDRNQIVDRLDSIARLISLNAPVPGIRGARETDAALQRERTPPPFEETEPGPRRQTLPRIPPGQLERTPVQLRKRQARKTPPAKHKKKGYLRQDETKLSPLLLKKAGVKDWARRK